MLAYGCCVGSWERFGRWVAPVLEGRPAMAVAGSDSIARTYNAILDWAARVDDLEGLVLLHDDLEILARDVAEQEFRRAIRDGAGLVGVAGGIGVWSLAWWEAECVGHQLTDAGMISWPRREHPRVDIVEGSCMALAPGVVRELRFDEEFPGFHGYDEFAFQVRLAGRHVAVADVDTHHHTPTGFRNPASAAEWYAADERFQAKWLGHRFEEVGDAAH